MRAVNMPGASGARATRRYLDLALASVREQPPRRRLTTRLGLTDGPFAETKEKVCAGS